MSLFKIIESNKSKTIVYSTIILSLWHLIWHESQYQTKKHFKLKKLSILLIHDTKSD